MFTLLVVMIGIGYRAPQDVSQVATTASALSATQQIDEAESETTVNEVVASTIAANVATTTNLSVAPSVNSLAISAQIESQLPTTDESTSRPAIVEVTSPNREIVEYTVEPGDTVASLADEFGLSKETIMWANDLTSENLTAGSTLDILPRNGVVYTVKSGDTIESIADKYSGDAAAITTYNDLEISGVTEGLKIIIPDGQLPETERPGYVAPVVRTTVSSTTTTTNRTSSYSSYYRSGSSGNRYAFGNCTYWVYDRRAEMGRPVGSFWGNANTWDDAARAQGYVVNNVPAVGAVLVDNAGYYGHVAVVESKLADGSIVISEMNNSVYGGFNIVNSRTISAGQAALYSYIH